jgi:hypothetical protein
LRRASIWIDKQLAKIAAQNEKAARQLGDLFFKGE